MRIRAIALTAITVASLTAASARADTTVTVEQPYNVGTGSALCNQGLGGACIRLSGSFSQASVVLTDASLQDVGGTLEFGTAAAIDHATAKTFCASSGSVTVPEGVTYLYVHVDGPSGPNHCDLAGGKPGVGIKGIVAATFTLA